MKGSTLRISKKKLFGLAVTIPLVGALLTGCAGGSDAAKGSESNPVKIGVVGKSDPQWAAFEKAASSEGIHVDIVDFTEYTQPNPALAEKELDLNEFQHIIYLANYNVKNDQDLTPIGATAIYPLGLYSKTHESIDQIPEGGTVAVPNDETNRARALGVLVDAGLIKLKGEWTAVTDTRDVDTDASKVKVTELSADQTANGLQDLDGAVVNNDFLKNADLVGKEPLAQSKPDAESAKPYINIFVSRAEDKDNETYLKLVRIFQENTDVQAALQEASGNTATPLTTSAPELQDLLKTTQDQITNKA
ncbi:methionine ABC transporter substrate-binding protein [Pseudoclavibacter sp. CFCC 13796]|nr:methionine ABC transporter substrate-binding protein [Pseudoclavibacter sp. CFCC 11306]KAB1661268.1 methionine ABC transporter substrate-binding protein [Pseudoclavibacter sp. CFCC 13796]